MNKNSIASLIAIFLGIVFFTTTVSASHVVLTSDGANNFSTVNEDDSHLYNFSVNNTDALANITQVNLTMNETFTFILNTNGTDAVATFTNTSTILSWTNSTSSLVNNGSINYFWFNATASTPGTYSFIITTFNGTAANTTLLNVTINDTTAPTTTGAITSGTSGDNDWYTTNVNYTLTPVDNSGVVNLTQYCVDTNNTCVPNLTYSTTIILSNEGSNYVRFNSTDNAGYVQTIQSSGLIKIDKTLPTYIITYSVSTSVKNGTAVNVTATFSEAMNGTFIPKIEFNGTATNLSAVNMTLHNTTVYYYNWTTRLGDGVMTPTVTIGKDLAGNSVTNTGSTRTNITVDNTAPAITLIAPANATSATTTAYNFTFNVTELNNISSCELIFDNTAYNSLTTVSNNTTNGMYNSSLAVGTHTWSVNCTDEAGNEGNSSQRTLTITATTTTSSSDDDDESYVIPTVTQSGSDGTSTVVYGGLDVSIDFDGEKYILDMDLDLVTTSVSFTIEGVEYTLLEGEYVEVDLDEDGTKDISIRVEDIRSPYAELSIKEISTNTLSTITIDEETVDPVVEEQIEEEQQTVQEEPKSNIWIYLVIGLVVFSGSLIYYFIRKNND